MEVRVLGRETVREWIGRPVWFWSRSDVNVFGWAFVHPDTVRMKSNFCRLILPDPAVKEFYSWDDIVLYDRPRFHGICFYCTKWYRRQQLTHCSALEAGKVCCFRNRYAEFVTRERGYSVGTFMRALRLVSGKLRVES